MFKEISKRLPCPDNSGTQDHTNGTLNYDSLGQLGKKFPLICHYKIKLPREKYTAQIFGER